MKLSIVPHIELPKIRRNVDPGNFFAYKGAEEVIWFASVDDITNEIKDLNPATGHISRVWDVEMNQEIVILGHIGFH